MSVVHQNGKIYYSVAPFFFFYPWLSLGLIFLLGLYDLFLSQNPRDCCTNLDYADDIALLTNSLAQAEFLLHILERAAGGISLHVNADKTEYMCFNQRDDTSTLKGGHLKLVDKFTYLGSSVSSTEKDINTRQAKAWTAIDKLLVIWKSDLTNEI